MATFSSNNRSTAIVPASRQAIWDVLSDPDALASLTPLVKKITADGDRWWWELAGISALGVSVAPSFTEAMVFVEGRRIEFRHDPPKSGGGGIAAERAGVNGTYVLDDAPDGATKLAIDLTMCVELPLPKVSRRAVEKIMATTMAKTGEAFARNLYERLGLDPSKATDSIQA